jgi:hypothetical protein
LTWFDSVVVTWPQSVANPSITVTECTPGGAASVPSATPAPTPTPPVAGISPDLPSGVLPAGYTLKWNQDFTSASYSPFNQPANISLAGPPGSIWTAHVGAAGGNIGSQFNGEGDPFSTSQGYLTIHANGSASPPYGGWMFAHGDSWGVPLGTVIPGFWASNAYWEFKAQFPAPGSYRWPLILLWGSSGTPAANGDFAEIDIAEGPDYLCSIHVWNGTTNTTTQSFTPGLSSGWHVWGVFIQPNTVYVYIDGVLAHTFSGMSAGVNAPCSPGVWNGFGPNPPATGSGATDNDLGIGYVRCWAA